MPSSAPRTRTRAWVAIDPTSQDWLTKAYAATAFAQLRTRHSDAAADIVAEQIRSFPDAPIGRIVGPEVASLATSVRTTLDARPRGSLRVTVSRPDVDVFLNEQRRGPLGTVVSLVPGTYRVLLVAAGTSRTHRVAVAPGRQSDLVVDWEADTAFTASTTSIGFVWPRGRDDKTERIVARYARAGRRHDILVVGASSFNGRRAIMGQVFEKHTGARVRRKAIYLDGDVDTCLRALSQHLVTGDPSRCLFDPPDAVEPALPLASGAATSPLMLDGSAESESDHASRSRRARWVPPALIAGGAALLITGGVLIKIDEDPDLNSPQYIRNSAPMGVGLAIAGTTAMVTGVALYFLWRGPTANAAAPVAAITGDAAYVGWRGRF